MLFAVVLVSLCLAAPFCSGAGFYKRKREGFPSGSQKASKSRKTDKQLYPIATKEIQHMTRPSNCKSSKKDHPVSKPSKHVDDRFEEKPSKLKSVQDSLSDSCSSKDEVITKSKRSKQPPQPDLFKTCSFCHPSALAKDDPLVARIVEEVKSSKAPRAALEHIFSASLQTIQDRRPESMERLRIADNVIPLIEIFNDWGVLTHMTVCSAENKAAIRVRTDKFGTILAEAHCSLAFSVIKNIYYKISSCFNGNKGFLSAGQFVAYLDVLLKAIEDHD